MSRSSPPTTDPSHCEIAASRTRLVAAADEARRRLERDLHDGAQQRFGLAARSPVPVELRVTTQRATPSAEAVIYFTVAEALTNVGKHAHATRASVTIDIAERTITADIADDGIGGAGTTEGSGLRGLADRLDAIGGTLSIDSPHGGPTTIRAQAPLPPHLRQRARSEALSGVGA